MVRNECDKCSNCIHNDICILKKAIIDAVNRANDDGFSLSNLSEVEVSIECKKFKVNSQAESSPWDFPRERFL